VEVYDVDRERDASEVDLARTLVKHNLPVLGICRGVQTLNVALGGTLVEHLPDVVGETVAHRLPPCEATPHPIRVDPESRLAQVLKSSTFDAVSWHHQAIRQLAPSLQPVAWAPDGVIEAVELPSHPWLMAVQWHPELAAPTDAPQQRLFQELVRQANARGKGGASAAIVPRQ
jgi:putative glutamine amidotransferase